MKTRIVSFFFNLYIVVFVLFLLIIVLYVFKLSNIYNPNFLYVAYLISVVFPLLIFAFSVQTKKTLERVGNLSNRMNQKLYIWVFMWLFFLLGTLANIYEYVHVGWPIFLQNKVGRGEVLHYVHYITNLLMYVMPVSYYLFRKSDSFYRKIVLLLVFLLSFAQLFVWLNRGFITLTLLFIVYNELIIAYKNNTLSGFLKKTLMLFVLFIAFFGYLGDMRVSYVMENIYGHSINFHYGMSEFWPTSFVWFYIYASSSLENFRHILFEQEVSQLKYGLLLIYPFVAPLFKVIFEEKVETYPYLDDIAGLNVSTFMSDAVNDFGMIGPYIYVVYMIFFLTLAIKLYSRGVFGLLFLISVLNMSFWMLFVNGFAIGPFMIGTLLFLIMTLVFEKNGRNYANC